jgi:hypothetical protein
VYVRRHLPQFPNGLDTVISCHYNVRDHERRKMFSAQNETLGPIICLSDLMTRAG